MDKTKEMLRMLEELKNECGFEDAKFCEPCALKEYCNKEHPEQELDENQLTGIIEKLMW